MNKIALGLWLSLVTYTSIYILFFASESIAFISIINGNADPFLLQFFNLMGLVPFYFLSDYLCFQIRTKFGILPFLFGFFGGAFTILIGYKHTAFMQKPVPKLMKILLAILMFCTAFIMIQGFLQGNATLYFRAFFEDALVGIMTMDFLVLYAWSIYRSRQLFRTWYLAFIPMVGFGWLMLWNQRR
ncbi:MAG: hypothetical protein RIS53_3 [Bacillota bacterium]